MTHIACSRFVNGCMQQCRMTQSAMTYLIWAEWSPGLARAQEHDASDASTAVQVRKCDAAAGHVSSGQSLPLGCVQQVLVESSCMLEGTRAVPGSSTACSRWQACHKEHEDCMPHLGWNDQEDASHQDREQQLSECERGVVVSIANRRHCEHAKQQRQMTQMLTEHHFSRVVRCCRDDAQLKQCCLLLC